MDLGKAFSFVFEDPNWLAKILLGGIIAIIPIIGWILVIGYMIAVARNVIQGAEEPLPEWSDFGQIIVDGVYGIVISLVYALPIIIVACIFYAPVMALTSDGSGNLEGIGALFTCCFGFFSIVYGFLAGWFFIPAGLGRYADTGDFMAGLRFNEVLAISRANPVAFLMALLVAWLVSFLAGFGVILCCVGVLFTSFYAQCVTGHVYGQAYREAKEKAV